MGKRPPMWKPATVAPGTRGIRAAAAAALVIAGLNTLAMATAPAYAAAKPCTLVGTSGPDLLRGTSGNDVICALGGDDKVLGLGGDDVLRGGRGDDTLRGGPGDDLVAGGGGDDRIFGQGGNDVARGDAGDDSITGGRGNDRMGGFKGSDTLLGIGDPGFVDDLRCGPDTDVAEADPADRVRKDCETATQNDPPTDITLDPAEIEENQFSGTDIGDLGTNDPDVGDQITYELVPGAGSGDNDQVEIDGDSLESAEEYDFEAQSELSVRIRATDSDGEFVEEALVVTVLDANDAPVAVDDSKSGTEDTTLEMPRAGAGSPAENDTDQDGDTLTVSAVDGAEGGIVTLLSDAISFEPDENLCGDDAASFDYTVDDGNGGTDTGTVTIDLACVDDAPVAVDDDATVDEDSVGNIIDVLANDTDEENDAISVTGVTDPANGTTSFTSGGVTYTPDGDYCNDPPPFDTFDYTINGGDTATVSVTVTCVNDDPTAVDDDASTTEDVDLVVTGSSLVANDTDIDGGPLTVSAVSNPSGGTVDLDAGTVTFTPTPNLCGADIASFDYTVSDGNGGTDTATVTIDITCVNDAPVAVDDTETTAEDESVNINDSTLVADDTDAEDDFLTLVSVDNATNGTVGLGSGVITFTPNADFCGEAGFDYTVTDGVSDDVGHVTVTVTCSNDAPVVDLDSTTGGTSSSATFLESDPHTGNGVLIAPNATVTDPDDTQIEGATAFLAAAPDGASESLSFTSPPGSGLVGTWTPAARTFDIVGVASKADYAAAIASIRYDNTATPPNTSDRTITITLFDGTAVSNDGVATVEVKRLNLPPVNIVPGDQTVAEDGNISFTSGISISVSDEDDTDLSITVTVTNGTFTLSGTSGLTVSGNGTATVTASGSIADLNSALNNATYAPTGNYNGPAQLTIETDDGTDTDTDSFAITVTPVNDAPTATNLSAAETYTEDTTKDLTNIVVSDVDSATVTVTLTLSSTVVGTLTTGTAGSTTSTFNTGLGEWQASGPLAEVNTLLAGVSYVPTANYNGTFAINTSVTDGVAAPVTGFKPVVGTAVNDAPTSVVPGAQTTDEDVAKVITGVSVADIDSPTPTVTIDVDHGVLTVASASVLFSVGDGTDDPTMTFLGSSTALNQALASITYEPDANYFGPDTLTVTVDDGVAPPVVKTVAITVTPVNDAPVADDETFDGAKRAIGNTSLVVNDPTDAAPDPSGPQKTVSGDILAGDTDVDTPLANLTVQAETKATTGGGTVTIEADGDFTYLGQNGCGDATDAFSYTVQDNDPVNPLTDTGTVNLTSADCVWYIDAAVASEPAAGVGGTSVTPFKTFLSLSGPGGVGDVDDPSDWIFAYPGTYAGGASLEASQQLVSARHGLELPDGGSGTVEVVTGNDGLGRSTITSGLSLGTDNTIQGIDAGTNAGFAISGTSVGSATINTLTSGVINNPTGGALRVDGTGNIVDAIFNELTSAGGANGVLLTNVDGDIAAGTGSLSGSTGAPVSITGGAGTFTYDGTISKDTGQLVSISGTTGGLKEFNGTVSDGPNPNNGGGVALVNNGGATISFDGGLELSTGATAAFSATGGGTVEVTGSTNTLTTTTGTPLTVSGTSIGAADLTFRSISSNGAPSGIVLNATGGSGGLTVAGNGGTCSSAATCTGGSIQGSSGDGVSLTNVGGGVSLTRMSVNGGGDDGVDASGVVGLTVDNSRVVSNGNAADEEGIALTNVTGAVAVTNSDVSGSAYNNLRLQSTSGTIGSLALTGSKFNTNSATTGNHGALIDIGGTSTLTAATVSGSEFKDNFSIGLQVVATSTGTIGSFTVDNNTFTGTSTGATTGTQEVAIDASKSGTSNATFLIQNNTITGHNSHGMNLFSAAGAGTGGLFRARVQNNTIGSAAVASSGSQIGNCMRVNLNGDSADTVLLTNNNVRQCPNGRGIEVIGRNGTGPKDVTVTNNTATPNDTSGFPLAAILVQSNCVTVCATVRSNVSGNTVPAGASFDLGAGFLQLIETSTSTLQLVGAGTCATQLAGSNTGSTSASAGCTTIAGPIGTPP